MTTKAKPARAATRALTLIAIVGTGAGWVALSSQGTAGEDPAAVQAAPTPLDAVLGPLPRLDDTAPVRAVVRSARRPIVMTRSSR